MKLSIVVPVHNMAGDNKLCFCLDSLLNQKDLDDYEIICVDDASTDASFEILEKYRQSYPEKLKVIHQKENLRQGGARNTGMAAATGEWLGFMDSDDWADPFMYAKLLRKAEETEADVVGCDYQLVHEHCFEKGIYVQNNFDSQTGILGVEQKKLLCKAPGSMVIKIYKREVILKEKLSFPERMFYEDNAQASIWMMSFHHFERVPEALYYYYQHDTSTVHVVNKDRLRDRIRAGEILLEEAKKRGFLEDYREELIYKYLDVAFCNTLFSYAQDCNAYQKKSGTGHSAQKQALRSKKMQPAFLKEMQTRIVRTLSRLQRESDLNQEKQMGEDIDYRKVKKLQKELKSKKASWDDNPDKCNEGAQEMNQKSIAGIDAKDIHYAYMCMITNSYYMSSFDKEQRKFLEMFLQSPGRMKRYYELLMWYRFIRYGG